MPAMPPVNVDDSAQNAFVQDWLTAYYKRHSSVNEERDWNAYENVIEVVQETYNYIDHGKRDADAEQAPVYRDAEVVGWVRLERRDPEANDACNAGVSAGRPWHAIPSGPGVTLPDYHFATRDEGVSAVRAAMADVPGRPSLLPAECVYCGAKPGERHTAPECADDAGYTRDVARARHEGYEWS